MSLYGGRAGVSSLDNLTGDVKMIQGPGIRILDNITSNGIEIATADAVIDLNDVLTNGNKTTRSANFLKSATDIFPSASLSSNITFGPGSSPPDTSLYYGTNSLGIGGLVVSTPVVNIANNNTPILASSLTISADTPGQDATNIILSENSTIHCSNFTSSGGINAVNCVATNGLTTPSLSCPGLVAAKNVSVSESINTEDLNVAGNLTAANLVFGEAVVENFVITGRLYGDSTDLLTIGSNVGIDQFKNFTFNNSAHFLFSAHLMILLLNE